MEQLQAFDGGTCGTSDLTDVLGAVPPAPTFPAVLDACCGTRMFWFDFGLLPDNWRDMLRDGFAECFRVLKPHGTLIFKWCEAEIPLREVLALTPEKPLYGHRSGKKAQTHWAAFMKPNVELSGGAQEQGRSADSIPSARTHG